MKQQTNNIKIKKDDKTIPKKQTRSANEANKIIKTI